MYVAGNFTSAGSVTASSIAKWNGTAWSALNGDVIRYAGSPSKAVITTMAFVGTDLYIAGKFDSIGTKPMWHLAKWNGSQWDSVSLGLKNDFYGVTDMAVDKNGRLYVVGKFTSVNGNSAIKYVARWNGSKWEYLGTGINNFTQDMFMAESDSKGNIFLSGYFTNIDGYNSQYLATWLNDPGIIETVKRIGDVSTPRGFELAQNYPNPFNPATIIRYGLPSSSIVSLKIYNILGQQIADLVNIEQQEGWYETTWNANVSTGLYFYRLEAVDVANPNNRFVQVKKMMLLR